MEESDEGPLCRQIEDRRGKRQKRTKINAIYLLLLAVAFVACFYALRWKTVVVIDGEEKTQFSTFCGTVGQFLDEKDLKVGAYDKVIPGKDEKIKKGSYIVVKRAFPVILEVQDKAQEIWTHAQTVAEFLQETGLYLGDEDLVAPGLSELLSPGQRVKVTRVARERRIETETIPFRTIRVANPRLEQGLVKVVKEGSDGLRENIVETVTHDGKEVSREIIFSRTIKEPVEQVLEHGTKDSFSRGGRTFEFQKVIEVTATAYCPGTPGSGCPVDARGASQCTGFNNDGYTYTGIKAVAGDGSLENPHIIAVDPAVIPLKSLVFIEGYGFARAEDTGSAIKGNSIDLLFNQHHDAWIFGRKTLKVYLLN